MELTLNQTQEMMERNHGDLDLSDSQIRALPKNLHVAGDLDLSFTRIQELPEGLVVGGNLHLGGSLVQELPKGLHVAGYIFMDVISSHLRTGFPEMDMEL